VAHEGGVEHREDTPDDDANEDDLEREDDGPRQAQHAPDEEDDGQLDARLRGGPELCHEPRALQSRLSIFFYCIIVRTTSKVQTYNVESYLPVVRQVLSGNANTVERLCDTHRQFDRNKAIIPSQQAYTGAR